MPPYADAHPPGPADLPALDEALARDIGHRLFTVLVYDWGRGESLRAYSSVPDAYPPGGAKPIRPGSAYYNRVIVAGEPQWCRDAADIRAAFSDHALILSLGCESAVNVPVRDGDTPLGSLNLLHQAGWYTPAMLPALRDYAAQAAPLLKAIIVDRLGAGTASFHAGNP